MRIVVLLISLLVACPTAQAQNIDKKGNCNQSNMGGNSTQNCYNYYFVSPPSKEVTPPLNNPPPNTKQETTPPAKEHPQLSERPKLPPTVCVSGSQVSPVRVTAFVGDPNSGLQSGVKANVGDLLSVNFRDGSSCNVTYCNPNTGSCYSGTVKIADIAGLSSVENIIRNLAINRVVATSLEQLPSKLREALRTRAASKQSVQAQYDESDLEAVIQFIRHCSEITENDYDEAFKRSLRGDGSFYNAYKSCSTTAIIGNLISDHVATGKRRLRVSIRLPSRSNDMRYLVKIQFERDKDADKNVQMNAQTLEEGAVMFYNIYGVGVYQIAR